MTQDPKEQQNARIWELISSSGILNPNMTLDQIMRLTEQLNQELSQNPVIGAGSSQKISIIFGHHFILMHDSDDIPNIDDIPTG